MKITHNLIVLIQDFEAMNQICTSECQRNALCVLDHFRNRVRIGIDSRRTYIPAILLEHKIRTVVNTNGITADSYTEASAAEERS